MNPAVFALLPLSAIRALKQPRSPLAAACMCRVQMKRISRGSSCHWQWTMPRRRGARPASCVAHTAFRSSSRGGPGGSLSFGRIPGLPDTRPYHESSRIRMNPNSLKNDLSIILIGSRINQDYKYMNINCSSPKSINCPRTAANCSSPNQSSQPQIVLRQRLGTSRSTCKTTPLGHLDSEAVGCQVLWVSLCSPLHVPP
jgi:hypothetical protein